MDKFSALILLEGIDENAKIKGEEGFYKICSKPLVSWVHNSCTEAGCTKAILCENGSSCTEKPVELLTEKILDGAIRLLGDEKTVVVVGANTPLLKSETIEKAVKYHKENGNSVTRVISFDVTGLYCIEKEIFSGLDLTSAASFHDALKKANISEDVFETDELQEFFPVTNRVELSLATSIIQTEINESLMLSGVTIIDPSNTYIEPNVKVGEGTVIYPSTTLKGDTVIGKNCEVGPCTTIENCCIGNETHIQNSILSDSTVGNCTNIGPFAYIRPNSHIGNKIKIGDFVEVKNSTIADGTKVSHLTYVGDSDVGENVNFGCGTVTVNYDGKKKHRTIIGDDVFIGCNTNLVAPVKINNHAFIAAGSTITDDVESDALAIARARQVVKSGWYK